MGLTTQFPGLLRRSVLDLGRERQRRTLDKVGGISTIIGEGSNFNGTLTGNDNVVVLGRVEGDCRLDATVVLEDKASWRGTIEADNIVVAGEVEGTVIARDKLEIAPSARIKGDVRGQVIAVAQGAVIEGQIQMTDKSQVTRFTEKRTQDVLEDLDDP